MTENRINSRKTNIIKLVTYSLFGIFMFFASFIIGEKTTIPVDHIVTWVRNIPYIYQYMEV